METPTLLMPEVEYNSWPNELLVPLTIVAVSGYFNPLHIGHIQCIKDAKALGDILVVIVNNDYQVKLKGSKPFMTEEERVEIVSELKAVDKAIVSIDSDLTVCETLALLNPTIFANGGDRTAQDIPEKRICDRLGIILRFGVGGMKIQSSSSLLNNLGG